MPWLDATHRSKWNHHHPNKIKMSMLEHVIVCYPCNVSYLVKDTKGFDQFIVLWIGILLSSPTHICQLHVLTAQLGGTYFASMVRNSLKSMVPLPSLSTSLIISLSSELVGWISKLSITAPNSRASIDPLLSYVHTSLLAYRDLLCYFGIRHFFTLSKRAKESLYSCICSFESWSAYGDHVSL